MHTQRNRDGYRENLEIDRGTERKKTIEKYKDKRGVRKRFK